MSNARRWYIYLVSAISFQAITWAIIALLRNLLIFGIDEEAAAFQVAVLIIGLPVFLIHWLWSQKLANQEKAERGAILRRIFLYAMLASLLAPFLANLYDLIRRLFKDANELQSGSYSRLSLGDAVIYHLIALLVLGLLWFYLHRVKSEDVRIIPEIGGSATVRRFYVLAFSAIGLTMVTIAIIQLSRWVMFQFGEINISSTNIGLTNELTRIIVGLPLWLFFWRWAQNLFDGDREEERTSALRKFYLYGAVFIGTMNVVVMSAAILSDIIAKLIGAPTSDGEIRISLSIIIGSAILWVYHTFVLRDDAKVDETTRQAGVRRLYVYLIAAIGFLAVIVGVAGILTVMIQGVEYSFGGSLLNLLAYSIAGILVGLPLWIIPWRREEIQSTEASVQGDDARQSVVRKIYIYFFLFIATTTALSSSIYIVYRLVDTLFGNDAPTFTQLAEVIALIAISAGIWLYHGSILRRENKLEKSARDKKLRATSVIMVGEQEKFEEKLLLKINEEIPELDIHLLWLPVEENTDLDILDKAELIIGASSIAFSGGTVWEKIIATSAQKMFTPVWREGWDWAGVPTWDDDELIEQTLFALEQFLEGNETRFFRSMGIGKIIMIVIALIILLLTMGIPVSMIFN